MLRTVTLAVAAAVLTDWLLHCYDESYMPDVEQIIFITLLELGVWELLRETV